MSGAKPSNHVARYKLSPEIPLLQFEVARPPKTNGALHPSFLKRITGQTPRESQQLLELLFEHVTRPEYTVRFRWHPGSVAFWDNRTTAHLAPRDIFSLDFDRQLYRITLRGDVLVGVDGHPSLAIKGDPIDAYPA